MSYAVIAAVPLLLWVLARPLARIVTLVGAAALLVCVRGVYRLARCFVDCGGFTLVLGGRAQITVSRIPPDRN